jgi:hypothetical protein
MPFHTGLEEVQFPCSHPAALDIRLSLIKRNLARRPLEKLLSWDSLPAVQGRHPGEANLEDREEF